MTIKRNIFEVEQQILKSLNDYRKGLVGTVILRKVNLTTPCFKKHLDNLYNNDYVTLDKTEYHRDLIIITSKGYNRLLELNKFLRL
jgi:predicted transcriptional regulator